MLRNGSTITLEEYYSEFVGENHVSPIPVHSPVLDPSCPSSSRNSDPPVDQGLPFSDLAIQTTCMQPETKK